MTYLDYSATTPVDKEVLDSFVKATSFVGNPNSLHKLGTDAKHLIEASGRQIAKYLGVSLQSIIYTSGASESNNTVLKSMEIYQNRGNHIITTELEHSSINEPLKYLETKGFVIDYVPLKNGLVDLEALEKMITDKTILVTISMVNSEIGIRQPIEKIGEILSKYPKVLFHSDITQAIGKIPVCLDNVDFASFSAHKFFGLKGIGCLIKKENVNLLPLIHGGKSTTIYRSGTPDAPLIVSMAKALRLSYEHMNEDIKRISEFNKILKYKLLSYENVYINSTENSIPHILNFSVIGIKPETLLHSLEEDEVYISTQSACAKGEISKAVMAVTLDEKRASFSVRVSISRKTTKEEILNFLEAFDRSYRNLMGR